MKPNFALNLSHDGISLLHRAKAGWLSVGDVSLDDPGLVDELGHLRRTATDLETGGLTTKLVIPNSQVLYTEVDAPGPNTADRIGQIRDALVGLTPYDVRDLVFDWRRRGKRAQVAVVARETLQEAEAFAVQYRFNPVSFVAAPNGDFDGEPFFGPTRHAATILTGGETVEPDAEPMRIIGPGDPAPEPPEKPKPGKAPAPARPDTAETVETAEPAATFARPAAAAAPPAPAPARKAPTTAPAAGRGTDDAAGLAAMPAFSHRRADPPPPAPVAAAAAGPAPEPPVTFASRRANGHAAAIPASPQQAARIAPLPEPASTSSRPPEAEPAAAGGAVPGDARAASVPLRRDPPPPVPQRRTPMPVTAPVTAGAAAKPGRSPRVTARAAGVALAGTLGKLKRAAPQKTATPPAAANPAAATPAGAKPTAPVPPPMAGRPAATPAAKLGAATEAEAMTVFGARGRPAVRGKPRYLGLVLTLILLLALAVLALWSTYFMSDVTQGWFGTFEDEPEIAVTDPAPGISAPSPVELATTPLPTTTPDTGTGAAAPGTAEAPSDAAPPATAETPAPPDEAAPEVAGAAPEAPAGESALSAAVETALSEAIAPPADDAPPAGDSQEIARLEEPPAEVALPETQPPVPVVRRPLTRPEAEARYAATGIWQLDPDPLSQPGSDRIDGLVVATIDPRIGAPDAATLPPESVLDTDLRPASLTPPAALGTDFDFDERGLVRATTEGAVTPSGIQIFLGAPAYVPGPRPQDLPVPQEETGIDDAQLSPRTPSPDASAEAEAVAVAAAGTQTDATEAVAAGPETETGAETEAEVASLSGFASGDLAAIRPAVRPASLWTEPEPGPDTPQSGAEETASDAAPETGLQDATALAVLASAPPAFRPQNFSSLVEEALQEAARSDPADAESDDEPEPDPSVASARVPSIPTRASVAKQATEANAINLGRVNLIGVYGTPSNRSALVRLKNGKFVKVEVGDRVDGGRVAAIGNNELRYVKGGRNITLKLPQG